MGKSNLEWVGARPQMRKSVRGKSPSSRSRTFVHVDLSDDECYDSMYSQSSVDEVHVTKKRVRFYTDESGNPIASKGGANTTTTQCKKSCCVAREAAIAASKPKDTQAPEAVPQKSSEISIPPSQKLEHTCGKVNDEKLSKDDGKTEKNISKKDKSDGESKKKEKKTGESSSGCCNHCAKGKESEKPKIKSEKEGKTNGTSKEDESSNTPSNNQNQKNQPNKADARQSSGKPVTKPPTRMPHRVIQPSRGDVVLREDVIECQTDPRPNAFFDIKTGVLRVYHGPIYGNPFASLVPLSSTMTPIGTQSPNGFALPPQQKVQNLQPKPSPTPVASTSMPSVPSSNDFIKVLSDLLSSVMAKGSSPTTNNEASSGNWTESSTTTLQNDPGQNAADTWGESRNANTTTEAGNNEAWGDQTGNGATAAEWGGHQPNNDDSAGWNQSSDKNQPGAESSGNDWGAGTSQANADSSQDSWGGGTNTPNNNNDNRGSWGSDGVTNMQTQQDPPNGVDTTQNQPNTSNAWRNNSQSQQTFQSNNTPTQNNGPVVTPWAPPVEPWGAGPSTNGQMSQTNASGWNNQNPSTWNNNSFSGAQPSGNFPAANNGQSGWNAGGMQGQPPNSNFAGPSAPVDGWNAANNKGQQSAASSKQPVPSGSWSQNNMTQGYNNSHGGPPMSNGGWGNASQAQSNLNQNAAFGNNTGGPPNGNFNNNNSNWSNSNNMPSGENFGSNPSGNTPGGHSGW